MTVWYLAIILALSLGLSIALYRVSSTDLTRDAARQVMYFNNFLGNQDLFNYQQLRSRQLAADQRHLKTNLLLFNLLVLIGGGGLSYMLARRTLSPIEEALEAQKRFSADASHELRTPLAAMQTEIEVALRDPKLGKKKAVELLGSNLEEINKLTSLSEGLLRLAGTGRTPVLNQKVSILQAAKQAEERLTKAAAAKNITIKQSVKPAAVPGDSQSLTDLTAILLDNAIKYSAEGGEVTITGGKRAKEAYLSVSDKGIGINKSDLPHIFNRFFRADSSRAKTQAGGYGLGLAIAKKIVEIHKGYIEVKSAPGKGATFTIHLPLA